MEESDKPWFEGPLPETIDEYVALEEHYRVDSLVTTLSQALNTAKEGEGFHLTDDETLLVAVDQLESEVNSGGFLAFLSGYATYASVLPLYLKALCELSAAELMERVIDLPSVKGYLASYPARSEDISDTDVKALNKIDAEYYEAGYYFCDALWRHIDANRLTIRIPQQKSANRGNPFAFLFGWLKKD